jgi:hypothetical protein
MITTAASFLASADATSAFWHLTLGELILTVATFVLVAVTVLLAIVSKDLVKATRTDAEAVKEANRLAMKDLDRANARTAEVAINSTDEMADVARVALTHTAPPPVRTRTHRPTRTVIVRK